LLTEYWQIDFCVAPSHVEWNTSDELIPYINKLSEIGIKVLPLKKDSFKKAIKKASYVGGYFNLFWIAEEVMPVFKLSQPNAITIVDSVDVHYAREETQAKLGQIEESQAFQTKKREIGIYKQADITIAVSKDDYHLLSNIEKVGNVSLIPNIVRVYPRKPGKREPKVVFIGSYTWYPNPDAVIWFVESIWPIVLKSKPKAEFLIIGSDPTDDIKRLGTIKGVKVIGYVPDTKPYFEIAALSVAPMRIGGGMKGKVNEAMAHGIPVVATRIGAQGFEAEHGDQMMIADDAQGFADCVIKLLQDDNLQREMGLAGQELNSAICSQSAVKVKIEELVEACTSLMPINSHFSLQRRILLFTSGLSLPSTFIIKGLKYVKREGVKKTLDKLLYGRKEKKASVIKPAQHYPILYKLCKPSGIIEFPTLYDAPLVSIIIPAYNQWDYTHACLDSIFKNSGDIKYEIILADDNSTDDTKFAEKLIKNVKIIRNENNLGFLFNCNNAAKYAKGKYILFLNNDTLVQADWLKWLIKPLEEKADVGLTGAKLVFSTGQLQEAGGIVFKDGSAMNYGREDNPDQSQYNYLKDVDYCSGACICIRKELWDKLKGFNTQYAPAYYEDTDFAMQIRAIGYRTIYQPKSVIVHFEGISNGIDLTAGIKNMQQKNQSVFFEKWKAELKINNYSRYENLFKARDRSKYKQTILLFDYNVPSISEHVERTLQLINHYSGKGYNIKFLPDNFLRLEPFVSEIEQKGVEVLYGEWYKENYLQWITENAENIDSICFIEEVLANKYSQIIKNLHISYTISVFNQRV
jgi:GT2 family glycosyltransferase/glycosyltransferase involved in cell wall biosynthesis